MTYQEFANIARQVAAAGALVMGPVTATVGSVKLPPAVSAVLTAIGGGLFWIEHHVQSVSLTPPTPPTPSPPTPSTNG